MMIPCPITGYNEKTTNGDEVKPKYWVEIPDRWLGGHTERADEARSSAQKNGFGAVLTKFAVSLALADDWRLPGLEGNPENWDFEQLDLSIIVWVNNVVYGDYAQCFIVPKVSSGE